MSCNHKAAATFVAIVVVMVSFALTRPARADGGEIRLSDRLVTSLESSGKGLFLEVNSKKRCPAGWKEVRVRTTSGDKPWRLCLRGDLAEPLRGSGADVAALNAVLGFATTATTTTTVAPPPPSAAPAAPPAAAPAPTQPAPQGRAATPPNTPPAGVTRNPQSKEVSNFFALSEEGYRALKGSRDQASDVDNGGRQIWVSAPQTRTSDNRNVPQMWWIKGRLLVGKFPEGDKPTVRQINKLVGSGGTTTTPAPATTTAPAQMTRSRREELLEWCVTHRSSSCPGGRPTTTTGVPVNIPTTPTTRPGFTPTTPTTRPGLKPTPTLPGPVTPATPYRPVPVV